MCWFYTVLLGVVDKHVVKSFEKSSAQRYAGKSSSKKILIF